MLPTGNSKVAHGEVDQHGREGELLAASRDRYRANGRAERTEILVEFVAVTGYHRKHAIRLLWSKIEPLGLWAGPPGLRG